MEALLHLGQRLVVTGRATPELLEYSSFLCLPVLSAAILEEAVKVFLCLSPALLDGGYEILFVCMAEVACDVGVLEGLQWREGGSGVQVRYRASQRGCIDVCLCQEIVSVRECVSRTRWMDVRLTLCRCLSVRSVGAKRVCATALRSGRG